MQEKNGFIGVTKEQLEKLGSPIDSSCIKWRVGSKAGQYHRVLAYVDARVVQDAFDLVLGQENWRSELSSTPLQSNFDEKVIQEALTAELRKREKRQQASHIITVPVNTSRVHVSCKLFIRINGEWICKEDVGTESNVDAEKGQSSDALKRAAVMWGFGRFLYHMPPDVKIPGSMKYAPTAEITAYVRHYYEDRINESIQEYYVKYGKEKLYEDNVFRGIVELHEDSSTVSNPNSGMTPKGELPDQSYRAVLTGLGKCSDLNCLMEYAKNIFLNASKYSLKEEQCQSFSETLIGSVASLFRSQDLTPDSDLVKHEQSKSMLHTILQMSELVSPHELLSISKACENHWNKTMLEEHYQMLFDTLKTKFEQSKQPASDPEVPRI